MRKGIRGAVEAEKPEITVGIDLGDRFSRDHYLYAGVGSVVDLPK